jgi:signal peptidase I
MAQEVMLDRRQWSAVRREVLYAALLICVLSFAISRWVWWPVTISGDSMVPNYDDGQPNFIHRLAYWTSSPKRGDVVALRVGKEICIKRIVGLPGERLEFRRGTIFVDGRRLEEPYPVRPLLWWLKPIQLGSDNYFVMGDNRTTSMLYAIRREDIIGKAMF